MVHHDVFFSVFLGRRPQPGSMVAHASVLQRLGKRLCIIGPSLAELRSFTHQTGEELVRYWFVNLPSFGCWIHLRCGATLLDSFGRFTIRPFEASNNLHLPSLLTFPGSPRWTSSQLSGIPNAIRTDQDEAIGVQGQILFAELPGRAGTRSQSISDFGYRKTLCIVSHIWVPKDAQR